MSILIVAYLVFLLAIAVFGAAALYHAYKFGFPGDKSRLGAFVYIVVMVALLIASFVLIGSTDFSGEEL